MEKRKCVFAVVVAGLTLTAVTYMEAQDWPQWRGVDRDGKVNGFIVPETWPAQFTQKWQVTVGQGDATPALVADRLYVFSRIDADEVVMCLNAGDV